jgi:hypothetical protein
LSLSYWLTGLAELYGAAGQIEAGLSALDESWSAAECHAERYYEAELYWLCGTLLQR